MENHLQQTGLSGPLPAATTTPTPCSTLDSAASFLQEEEDEFERLFTELLYASHSKAAAKMADIEEDGGVREPPPPPPPSLYSSLKRCPKGGSAEVRPAPSPGRANGSSTRRAPLSEYERSLVEQGVLLSGGEEEDEEEGVHEQDTYWVGAGREDHEHNNNEDYYDQQDEEEYYSDETLSDSEQNIRYTEQFQGEDNLPVLQVDEDEELLQEEELNKEHRESHQRHSVCGCTTTDTDSMERASGLRRRKRPTQEQLAAFRKSHSLPVRAEDEDVKRQVVTRDRHSEGSLGSSGTVGRRATALAAKGDSTGDKLFFDLLDDLDNLTGNTDSMKRRARARDIFSDWLFSEQTKSTSSGASAEQKKKNRKSFHEFMSYREDDDQPEHLANVEDIERQNRAGSEPSEGRHGGGNNSNNAGLGNHGFSPLQRKLETQASMSDRDAQLERRIKEDYLVTKQMPPRTGSRSPATNPLLSRDGTSSPIHSPVSGMLPLSKSATSLSQPVATPVSPLSKPSGVIFNNSTQQQPLKNPQISSPSPATPPVLRRAKGVSGFSANQTSDTLEILKNVKFRKKSPKCQVFSEAEAKEECQHLNKKMSALGVGPRNIYQRWKLKGRPISFEYLDEDDADSGYHTGESTLCGGGGAPTTAPPPPGERTLSREDLKRRIDAFNDNQHGLLMTLRENSDTFQGFIRVYMNLMRPISMSLTARPPSIYDILTPDVDPSEYESDTQLTSFYLPKDTTKVIHITSDTTAQEVIRALLHKFRITDNPRKFALYERIDDGSSKSTMRRLRDDECPLPLCLCWTAEGLNFHRFILQENDTGEIIWEAFSVPELDNFLRILDREEEEHVEQVKAKYSLMKIQMAQHMKHLDQQKFSNKDQRTPVFV